MRNVGLWPEAAGHSYMAGIYPLVFLEDRALGRGVSVSSTLWAQQALVFSSDGNRPWLSPASGRVPEKRSVLPSFLSLY